MASSYNIKQNKNKFQNKKTQSQINNLGKELFLLGLNYDGGTTETVLNSKMITAMMKNTPPHLLNEKYLINILPCILCHGL